MPSMVPASRPSLQSGLFCFAILLLTSIISPYRALAEDEGARSAINLNGSSAELTPVMLKARPINPLSVHIQPPNSPPRLESREMASLQQSRSRRQGSYGASPIGDYQRQNINDYGRHPPSTSPTPLVTSPPPVHTTTSAVTTSATSSQTTPSTEESTSSSPHNQTSYQTPTVRFSASLAALAAPSPKRPRPPLAPPTIRLADASNRGHRHRSSHYHAYVSAQPPAFRPQPPNILPHAFGALSLTGDAEVLRDVAPYGTSTDNSVQQPAPARMDAHRYYYPPRMPLPLPQCFHNPTGYPCCNPTLNDLMVETYSDLEASPRFHTCNINAIASMLQARAEKKFNTSFETIAAFDDFAQKIHFMGDLVCKVELGGKYMLAYGTVRDAARYVSHEEEDAHLPSAGSTAYGAGRKKRSSAEFDAARVSMGAKSEVSHSHISQHHTMWI